MNLNLWLVILVGGLLTFLIRLSFILLIGQRQIAPWLRRGLRFVPTAVLTAIILPELLVQNGHLDVSLSNARLLAGLLAGLVAWRTRSAVLTILAGMVALWVLQSFF
jgi:branched-subunit amino acid transport protein